jgi:hypothetical protein
VTTHCRFARRVAQATSADAGRLLIVRCAGEAISRRQTRSHSEQRARGPTVLGARPHDYLLAVPALSPGNGVTPQICDRLTSPAVALRNTRIRVLIAVRLLVANRLLHADLGHDLGSESVEGVASAGRQRPIDRNRGAVREREAPSTLSADPSSVRNVEFRCLQSNDCAAQATGLETDNCRVEIHADDGDPPGPKDEDLGTAVRLAKGRRPHVASEYIGVLIQYLADRGAGVAPPADVQSLEYGVDLSPKRMVCHRDRREHNPVRVPRPMTASVRLPSARSYAGGATPTG